MLKIQVDLQKDYAIIVCERNTATQRRKTSESQHCFVKQHVKCHEESEYLTWQWLTNSCAEKEKGLVLLKVLALSQKDQQFYEEQK